MKSVKIPQYLYTASLFFLIFLTAVCVAVSGADVIIQALTDKTSNGQFDPRNLLVVSSSYVLLALASLLFSCSRMLTVRSSLQDIPKLYIPIKKEDLPKKVFLKIQQAFEKAKETRILAEPRPEDIQAVGRAKHITTTHIADRNSNTHMNHLDNDNDNDNSNNVVIPPEYDGMDFRQIISNTPQIIERYLPHIQRPPYITVPKYLEYLVSLGLVNEGMASQYLHGYEKARFSDTPLTPKEYMEAMKALAVIVNQLKIQYGDPAAAVGETDDASSMGSAYHRASDDNDSGRLIMAKIDTAASSILSSFSGFSGPSFIEQQQQADEPTTEEDRDGHETSFMVRQQRRRRTAAQHRHRTDENNRRPSSSASVASTTTSHPISAVPSYPLPPHQQRQPQHRNSLADSSGSHHRSSHYGAADSRRKSSSSHQYVADDARSWMSRSTYHTYTSHSSAGTQQYRRHPHHAYRQHHSQSPAYQQQQSQHRKQSLQRPISYGSSISMTSMISLSSDIVHHEQPPQQGGSSTSADTRAITTTATATRRDTDLQKARSLRTARAIYSKKSSEETEEEDNDDNSLIIETDEDEYSLYDEDEVRQDIYEILMKDKSSQPQLP